MRIVVIGGGISGLASAFRIRERFEARGAPVELLVLEAEGRLGGKIRSEAREGFLLEWGPNGFLDNKPETLDLCRDLGIEGSLLPAEGEAKRRYIFSGGRLHPVPDSPVSFFRSPLLSPRGRLRIVKELWAPVTPAGLDTSIAEFGRRRLGEEAVEKLLDPMVSGIFAGDPAVLSLRSCFPRMAELERDHGSLIRALVALRVKEKRTGGEDRRTGGPAGPGGTLTSFRAGTEAIVKALEERLEGEIRTGCVVTSLGLKEGNRGGGGYEIVFRRDGGRERTEADAVVLALPAYAAADILHGVDSVTADLVGGIPYAPLVVVALGFPAREMTSPLDGFGFVVPYREGTPVLGSLWTSSIFRGRAPEGFVLTRNMVGGWRYGWILALKDEELEAMALGMLRRALGRLGEPSFRAVIRHPRAIPLYTLGHERRVEKIRERLQRFPGLYLTGNAFGGVGLNDCTREAVRVAREVERDGFGSAGSAGDRRDPVEP